jgi:uncharacterized protein YcbX
VVPATLAAIHVHPIKSCRAIGLDHVEVTERGLADDRTFQVVDADGNPITQRQAPVLATVQPEIVDGGLVVNADGKPSLDVANPAGNDSTANSLLGVPVQVGDAGDEVADWFTSLLGVPARLVGMSPDSVYKLPLPGLDVSIGFVDAAQVVVANSASSDWLAARASEPFGVDRFRPNLTVDAVEAWEEDTWREFSIGRTRLGMGLAWPRCAIPQVDQVDGSRHAEPAKVLRAHRWCSDASNADEVVRGLLEGNALFGIACSIAPVGETIAVGDEVVIHETGDRVIDAPA